MFRLCPVRASARSSRRLPRKDRRRARISIHPSTFARIDADEELAADALKGTGQPEPTAQDIYRRHPPPRVALRIVGFAVPRWLYVAAVHYGLKFMFEAQQIRSDRLSSVHVTRGGRHDAPRA